MVDEGKRVASGLMESYMEQVTPGQIISMCRKRGVFILHWDAQTNTKPPRSVTLADQQASESGARFQVAGGRRLKRKGRRIDEDRRSTGRREDRAANKWRKRRSEPEEDTNLRQPANMEDLGTR